MKTFILFIYTNFQDHDDVEFFCINILQESPLISKLKYVIEDTSNSIIVIFESESDRKDLAEELHDIMKIGDVKFYFLFERDSLYTANLPSEMKEFIFKPSNENKSLTIEVTSEEDDDENIMNLDTILEKIENQGINSLSNVEKKFLDNFRK
jgi:hypothetical protein